MKRILLLFFLFPSLCFGQQWTDGWTPGTGVGSSETYGSGWNGDAYSPQKNDVYDYLHQFDVDDDGDVDTIDATYWATKLNASEKAAASGVATLDGSSKVVQDPANATATPTASKIPIADGSGKLDGWISSASGSTAGIVTPDAPGETGATTPYKDHNRQNIKIISTTPVTLTAAEFCNGLILITTGASVINLPAGDANLDGGTCEFLLIAAVAASVDPNGVQQIWDGSDYTAGNKATFSGVSGESFKLTWSNTNSRFRMKDKTGIIIDGGA
jgi:hypothetical protein